MLRVNEIKMPLDCSEADLRRAVAKELHLAEKYIKQIKLHKKAVDARKKDNLHFTYCVDAALTLPEAQVLQKCRSRKVTVAGTTTYAAPMVRSLPQRRPVIIGMGPAGLLCGVILAEAGLKPILLDRGESVYQRQKTVAEFWRQGKLEPNSNVQFGQGGAGAFSDGKLTTNTKDKRNSKVLAEFVAAGAPAEILYLAKPHVGTDLLRDVVNNLGKKIENLGGELRFNSQVIDFRWENCSSDKKISGLLIASANEKYELPCDDAVLAIGHSARDTFYSLYAAGVPMVAKPFSVGARIEHLQSAINRCQYGAFAEHPALGAADYKLSCHLPNGRSVYTFCMCPGGVVVNASSETGAVVTNGMSFFKRAGVNANAAVLVDVKPADFGSEHPLAGVEFQRQIERKAFQAAGGYFAIGQKVGDFLSDQVTTAWGQVQPSCLPRVCPGKIDSCLPEFVTATMREGLRIFAEKMTAFAEPDAVLTAPETRSSSPVRILRNTDYQSFDGLYPCGEGAGYAGGIMSAAADGIRVAEAIIKKY